MSYYYSPRREVRLKAEQKGTGKATVIAAAILTFVASIFIGRWMGMKLLESRSGIKSPATVEGYQAPGAGTMGQPLGGQTYADPQRQNISAPPLVMPPPVVEPKTATENSENSSDQPSAQTETLPKEDTPKPKPITLLPKEKPSGNHGSTISIYKVQTGLFSTMDNAKELVESLEKQGYAASFESISRPDGSYYRVWVGPYDKRNQAETAATELNGNGYQAFVIEELGK